MVWETPSNQYNHCILIQPSQKGGTVYFSRALRIPTHIRDNPSHLQDAQFVGSRAKHKCFSLASFDVNHCVLSAFEIPHGEREREREQASGKAHMDRFLRSSNIADSKRLISARGEAFDDGCHNFAACIWGRHQTCLLHVLLKAN